MRRLSAVLLALMAASCASIEGKASFFSKTQQKVNPETVQAFVCLGKVDEARQWLEKKALSAAEVDELIIQAQWAVSRDNSRCKD